MSEAVAFKRESSLELNNAAAKLCTATLLPVGSKVPSFITVNGCPKCKHQTHDMVPLEIVGVAPVQFVRRGAPGTELEEDRLNAALGVATEDHAFRATALRCNCSETHAGAGKQTGCGRFWSVDVTLAGLVSSVNAVPSVADLERTSALKEWSAAELPNVRKTATAWQAGFAGLIATVSAVLLIKGPESILELVDWARISLVILLGLALLLAIAASVMALLAANGLPDRKQASAVDPVVAAHNEAVTAVKRLRSSVTLAVTGTVLMAVAVGISWLGVSASGNWITLKLTQSPSQVCGLLVASSNDNQLTIRVLSGDLRSFPMSDILSVAPVDDCTSG